MSKFIVTGVPRHAIHKVWDDVEPLLSLVDLHDRLSVDHIKHLLTSADMQLWLVEPIGKNPIAAALTEVVTYPNMRVLRVIALGGKDMDDWIDQLNDSLDQFGQLIEAKCIEAQAREGLARRLKKSGYARMGVLIQKPVPDEAIKKTTLGDPSWARIPARAKAPP